jgi:hypothetical protein
VNIKLRNLFLGGLLLIVLFASKPAGGVGAQVTGSSTGTLIVKVSSAGDSAIEGLKVRYKQVSHDFLMGYNGPLPESGLPSTPYGFNLDLKCIPWVEIEPHNGYFPHVAEEDGTGAKENSTTITGNDCLLYFGEDARDDIPEDLSGLEFEVLLKRTQNYLEHAVRYETAKGVSLFVIKEPSYPTANLLDLSVSQWPKLVKMACQVIHEQAPGASIVIEIIPQHLPSRSYKPYSFLDGLIREGANYDGIMMVFSPPIFTRFTKTGYPSNAWVDSQVDVYSDLGKRLLVRFSGVTSTGVEADRQAWLEEMYSELRERPMVRGVYWDELLRFPYKLTEVSWAATPPEELATSEITIPLLTFIRDRTSSGMLETDSTGMATIYAFAGEYEITVEGIPGVTFTHIYRGEERRLDITLPNKATPQQNDQIDSFVQTAPEKIGGRVSAPVVLFIAGTVILMIVLGVAVWKREHRIDKSRKKHG